MIWNNSDIFISFFQQRSIQNKHCQAVAIALLYYNIMIIMEWHVVLFLFILLSYSVIWAIKVINISTQLLQLLYTILHVKEIHFPARHIVPCA